MSAINFLFVDGKGNAILDCHTMDLPIREDSIIEKSIELFNDQEPCIIHKSFCRKKILFEILEYFESLEKQGQNQIIWEDMPANIQKYIDIHGSVQKVVMESHKCNTLCK